MRKRKISLQKIILVFGEIFLFLFLFCHFSFASFEEKIKDFKVEIKIFAESIIEVEEKIVYDFGANLRHGIYREIPEKDIEIEVVDVKDEKGESYPYQVSKRGGKVKIKIGDPQKLISGVKEYNIKYKVKKAIRYLKNYDELYWNVTGNEWQVPIENSSVLIIFPQKISFQDLKFSCYTGKIGSKESACFYKVNENEIYFEAKRAFSPGEGLTVAVGFPKGIVREPSFSEKLSDFLKKWGVFLLPLFLFFYLFWEWEKKGKDIKIKKAITPQYEPPFSLKPAEVSLILHQKITPRDISATIIHLATRGYIKIKEVKRKVVFFTKKDWILIKKREFEEDPDLSEYEKFLLRKLFGEKNEVSIYSLKHKFVKPFQELKKRISVKMTEEGFFTAPPEKVRNKYSLFGIVFFILGFGILIIWANLKIAFSFGICGVLFLIFSRFMPKRTKKGAEAYWQILGFEDYIKTAEKYRAEFYEKANIFEKYLPYAIVFNLVDKWARAFEGIYNTPPEWYEGSYLGAVFSTSSFVNSLNSSISSFSDVFSSRSGSTGGGSAGGGAGGGGGGSW